MSQSRRVAIEPSDLGFQWERSWKLRRKIFAPSSDDVAEIYLVEEARHRLAWHLMVFRHSPVLRHLVRSTERPSSVLAARVIKIGYAQPEFSGAHERCLYGSVLMTRLILIKFGGIVFNALN